MDFYLVGTNHAHQVVSCKHGVALKFKGYLSHVCETESIDLLAEELSEESIEFLQGKDSVVRQLATERHITHIFCDANSDQRRELGILKSDELKIKFGYGRCLTHKQQDHIDEEEVKFWPIREKFWLDKVTAITANKCLFVLGANHVESFSELLSNQGFNAEIKIRKWDI